MHGKCFMYRIGPTLYASCEYGINRCSTPQLVYEENLQLCLCRTTAPTKELQKEYSELDAHIAKRCIQSKIPEDT